MGLDTVRFEGREQGKKEGFEQGRVFEKQMLAQKMKEAGMDPDLIKTITGGS